MTIDPAGLWVQTASGTAVMLLEPEIGTIHLFDIAHHLSRIARFNGATRNPGFPYSVAQHSMLVEALMPVTSSVPARLFALLHDAHEAYLGDLTSPVQRTIKYLAPCGTQAIETIRNGLDKAIFRKFSVIRESLDNTAQLAVRNCDLVALALEADILMYPPPMPWVPLPVPTSEQRQAAAGMVLPVIAPDTARERFRDRVTMLMMNVRGCN